MYFEGQNQLSNSLKLFTKRNVWLRLGQCLQENMPVLRGMTYKYATY